MINILNLCGEHLFSFAAAMLVQSSILIAVLFLIDWVIKKRARAVFRYSLGLLVLIKLLLPASFAAPTGVGYWLTKNTQPPPVALTAQTAPAPSFSQAIQPAEATVSATPAKIIQHPSLTFKAGCFLSWIAGMALLTAWIAHRSRLISKMVRAASEPPSSLIALTKECSGQLGITRALEIKICQSAQSPALCGLLHPTILIPVGLARQLPQAQLRAVLLHELAHFKRHDLWVNHLQTLLQVAYWWHPLLWLANARLQRLREEAVDETVMVAMQNEAAAYPETLLTIARLSFTRSLLTLGLIGIIESKSALKHRIRRVIEMEVPASEKLYASRAVLLVALAALLLPMACRRNPSEATKTTTPESVAIEIKYVHTSGNGVLTTDFDNLSSKDGLLVLKGPMISTQSGRRIISSIEHEEDFVFNALPTINEDNGTIQTEAAIQIKAKPMTPGLKQGPPYFNPVQVKANFSVLSGGIHSIALETNTPCHSFALIRTLIITKTGYPQPYKAAPPITVLQPSAQQTKSISFPVLTAASVEKQIARDGGQFTIDTAVKILKEIKYTPGKTVGFDQTFLDRFQDKGATLFMAGAMVMEGNQSHVEGIVEPLSSKSKTRTRTFHVDSSLFRQNVEARRSKNLSPEPVAWTDIFKLLLEEAGLDCDSGNNLTFNQASGELTVADSQNIDTVERIVLDLNQPNDKTRLWLPVILNRPSLLTEAMFIKLTDAAFDNLQLKPEPRTERQVGDYYLLNAKDFVKAQAYLSNNGSVLSRPRTQSVAGIESGQSMGTQNGSVDFSFVNYTLGKKMKMTIQASTTGQFANRSSDWPDALGQTNVAIYANIPISTNGGVLFRIRNSTSSPANNLVLLTKVSLVK